MVAQEHRSRGGAAGVATAVAGGVIASLLATTGCTQSGAVAEDRRGADPVDVVHRAAERLVRAGSSKVRTSMEMATGGTRVTIRGEGTYDFRKRIGMLKVVLPQDPAGVDEHRPITELLAPGALYMKNRGAGVPADKWVRVETAELSDGNLVTGGATDPMAAAELLRGAREVEFVGEEKLAGTPVRHYRGTADIGRAADAASPGMRGALRAAEKGFAEETVSFDAYLDDEGRLRKVRHRFGFTNGTGGGTEGGAKRGESLVVASTTLLYGFGTPADVRLPARKDIFAGKIAES